MFIIIIKVIIQKVIITKNIIIFITIRNIMITKIIIIQAAIPSISAGLYACCAFQCIRPYILSPFPLIAIRF